MYKTQWPQKVACSNFNVEANSRTAQAAVLHLLDSNDRRKWLFRFDSSIVPRLVKFVRALQWQAVDKIFQSSINRSLMAGMLLSAGRLLSTCMPLFWQVFWYASLWLYNSRSLSFYISLVSNFRVTIRHIPVPKHIHIFASKWKWEIINFRNLVIKPFSK